jgi:hypothetical protein
MKIFALLILVTSNTAALADGACFYQKGVTLVCKLTSKADCDKLNGEFDGENTDCKNTLLRVPSGRRPGVAVRYSSRTI